MLGDNSAQVVHSFIIRHPVKAIASLYYKSCIDNVKTGYTYFDRAEAGFTEMYDILKHVEKQPGATRCVIIDADDLLADPEGVMTAYCKAVGLPFDKAMLSWQPGPVKELESPWSGWTDDVVNSSGITRRSKSTALPSMEKLPLEVREAIAEAMPVYEKMHARRLLADREAAPTTTARVEIVIDQKHGVTTQQSIKLPATVAPPTAPPLAKVTKSKPIGASFSCDEVLFKFKTAHPMPCVPIGNERIVSLSRPIRAVLTADILLSAPLLAA